MECLQAHDGLKRFKPQQSSSLLNLFFPQRHGGGRSPGGAAQHDQEEVPSGGDAPHPPAGTADPRVAQKPARHAIRTLR